MANIPLDTRFIGIGSQVNLVEKKSSVLNAETQPYTMQDIVDTAAGGVLPSQAGENGKFLTTDGTTASWGTVNGATPVWQGYIDIAYGNVTFTEIYNSTGTTITWDNTLPPSYIGFNSSAPLFTNHTFVQSNDILFSSTSDYIFSQKAQIFLSSTLIAVEYQDINTVSLNITTGLTRQSFFLTIFCNP